MTFTAPASFDPYHDHRTYNYAKMMDGVSSVSPLCAKRPRKLNIARYELWTLRPEAVTCGRCKKLMNGGV